MLYSCTHMATVDVKVLIGYMLMCEISSVLPHHLICASCDFINVFPDSCSTVHSSMMTSLHCRSSRDVIMYTPPCEWSSPVYYHVLVFQCIHYCCVFHLGLLRQNSVCSGDVFIYVYSCYVCFGV